MKINKYTKQKNRKVLRKKQVYNLAYIKIKSSINNSFITLTDNSGKVLLESHVGHLNISKARNKGGAPLFAKVFNNFVLKLQKSNFHIRLLILEYNSTLRLEMSKKALKRLRRSRVGNVFFISYSRKCAHNGVRLKKKKRK